MNRLLDDFSKITLRKSLVLLGSVSLLAAFLLIFVLSGVVRDRAAQELAHEDARQTSKMVFETLYLAMDKGWDRREIGDMIARLSNAVPDLKIKVYRGAIVAQQFGEVSGEAAIIQSDAALSQALASGQEALLFPDKQNIRHLYPVTAKAECLVCHTQSHIGAVYGVIDLTYPIQTLKVSISKVTNTIIAYTLLVLGLVFAGLVAYLKQRETQRRLQIQEEANKALEQVYDALRVNEERFRQINASAMDAIVIVNEQGRLTDWNLAAQRMFQYSGEEAVGRQVHQLIAPPRYHADAVRGFAHFKESGEGPLIGKTTEISALRKDGSEFPVELSISPAKLKGCWHAIGIMRDVTERKRAEDALRESEARNRFLFENMLEGCAYCKMLFEHGTPLDFIYLSVNGAFEKQTGLKNVAGKKVTEVIPGIRESNPELFEIYGRVALTGKTEHFETYIDVLGMWFSITAYSFEKESFVAVVDNITERKQAEQKKLEAGVLLRDALEDAIGAIAATLEQRDPYTAGHQRRVAQLAVAIGEEMGLAPEVLEGINFGGLIHDIGKISVPAEILGKPGRITDIELGLIKIHAEAGYEIVKGIAFPWPVADMVRQHHERLDGTGYPQGLKDDQIILEARILAVADVVEAMLANRPYRPGLGMDAALDEITRARGTQFDPVVVDACLRVIKEKGFAFTKA